MLLLVFVCVTRTLIRRISFPPPDAGIRSFLLASLQNVVDRARRLQRGGDKQFVPHDTQDAEERSRLAPEGRLSP